MEDLFKVSTSSHTTAIAGAINQAVRAISSARGYLVDDHLDDVRIASFLDRVDDGSEPTAIRLHAGPPGIVSPRRRLSPDRSIQSQPWWRASGRQLKLLDSSVILENADALTVRRGEPPEAASCCA